MSLRTANDDLSSPDDWAEPPPSVHGEVRVSAPSPTRSRTLAPGTLVGGRYRVLGILGEGGFGVVYDAEHIELQRPVALKVLNSELTQDPTLCARFQQEARTAAAIGHPNIVQIFDLGQDQHGAFIAMEKLDGEELSARIARSHPLPEAWVARVGAEIADAMAPAHERGVIHRDIKPQNVFLVRQGRREDMVKVIDFGIAKLVDHRVKAGDLTTTGQLFGTPRFMAPEQFRSTRDVDARADIYAIGALLYRSLTSAYPFDAPTYPELLLMIMSDTPAPLRRLRPDVSERMEWIVAKAMSKNPDQRFASARELADALLEHAEHLERGQPALPVASAPTPAEKPKSSLMAPVLVLGAVGVLLLGALVSAGVYVFQSRDAMVTTSTNAPRVSTPAPIEAARSTAPATFHVSLTAVPANAELVLDGTTVGRGSVVRELARDGVVHTLVVRADGYAPVTLSFVDQPPSPAHIVLSPLAPSGPTNPAPPSIDAVEPAPTAQAAQPRRRVVQPIVEPPRPMVRSLAPTPTTSPQPARGAHSAPIVF